MSKLLMMSIVLCAGCAVSAPTLLSCSPGEAAVVQPDGAWGCQLVAVRNTQPLSLWVRTDGSDTTCSGQVNAPAARNGSSCAVASLQHAIDLVPAYVEAAVTITIGDGTFVAPASQTILAQVSKAGRPSVGSITIVGSGSTILQGATGVAGTVGVELARSSMPVTLQNVTISGFSSEGIRDYGSRLTLSGVTVEQAGSYGLECLFGAECYLGGTCSFENGASGISAAYGTLLEVEAGATVSVSNNSSSGMLINYGSELEIYGDLTVSSNQGSGIDAFHGSSAYFHTGNVALTGNGGAGLIAESFGDIEEGTTGTLTIQVPGGGGPGIHAVNGGYINVIANMNPSPSVSIVCAEQSAVGVEGDNHSAVDFQGVGGISISGCGTGLEANYFSYVRDLGGGGSRTDSSDNEYVNNSSIYVHGAFPAALCATGGQFWCQ